MVCCYVLKTARSEHELACACAEVTNFQWERKRGGSATVWESYVTLTLESGMSLFIGLQTGISRYGPVRLSKASTWQQHDVTIYFLILN